ncbi:MAG: ATP-binding protein [Burkholderiales bacterium]|nr:MAG: ATP-binding protein [Burkholderiales bacterium]
MFDRIARARLDAALARSPAVAVLGPRQVGKTTLARAAAAARPGAVYLDLETAADLARLADPARFLASRRDRLVVLDEVQNAPELFGELRAEIDADRRSGRFLILGSASFRLLRQSQTLAGRLAVVDMSPLLLAEIAARFEDIERLWVRGGFPGSFTAGSDADSWGWRQDFVRHFLNIDLAAFGIAVDPPSMGRLWRMLAHLHGQLLNASALSRSLGVSAPTVGRWIDHLVDALVVRRLEPFHANLGKRLVKSPKLYLRDSGLLHALLGVSDADALAGHPGAGASWEGFVIEQICARLPAHVPVSFYRTAAGAELDLVIEAGGMRIGIEAKLSSAPTVTKGFWQACEDVGVSQAWVVAPVRDGWPIGDGVEVVSPLALPVEGWAA